MRRSGRRRALVAIGLSCILVLAGWARIVVVRETAISHPLSADARDIYASAYNLLFHGTYTRNPAGIINPRVPLTPDSVRYPGLPLIVAALIWRDHRQILSVMPTVDVAAVLREAQMLNVAAGVAAVALIFFVANLALPSWAALAAALLTAISPHLISFTVYLLTETIAVMLTCALLAAVAAVAAKTEGPHGWGPFIALGIIVGVLTMFRPVYLLCAPVIALAFPSGYILRRALAGALLGTVLTVSPWFIRSGGVPNYVTTAALDGAYPGYMLHGDPHTFPYAGQVDRASTSRNASDTPSAFHVVVDRFTADPLSMATWFSVGKLRYLWQWDNIDGAGDVFVYPVTKTPFTSRAVFRRVHDVMKAGHWWLIALAAIGSIAAWIPATRDLLPRRGRPVLRAASLLLAYTSIMRLPFFTCTRYAVPVFPALFMMAMVPPASAAAVIARWRRRSLDEPEPAG